jgi:hypothetical protein
MPCPPWCDRADAHKEDEDLHDREHGSASFIIELTLERYRPGDAGGTGHLDVGMYQGYRESAPYICLLISDHHEVNFELAEAAGVARLLAAPPEKWQAVTLTMMQSEAVMPSTGPRGTEKHSSLFASFPFTRSAVLTVREVLDTVMVFGPVQSSPDHDQSPRYLALTPAEARELAAALSELAAVGRRL